MSIICGVRKPPGGAVRQQDVLCLAAATERYAKDGTSSVALGRIGMGFQPFHTHERSNLELQPLIDRRGNMIALDGRIDNHAELCKLLGLSQNDTSDSLIVLSAFLRWGDACFSKLIGDWALALWSASEQVVYLVRDHAGSRSLYFRNDGSFLQWSTCLETFFVGGEAYPLDEEYAARYLGSQPILDLTPYQGIRSVPPAHYLVLHDNWTRQAPHWEWMAKQKAIYKSDMDYEEHFLSLFAQSVSRRDGPGAPKIAQLSGGMDSTSIVSMSDHARRLHNPDAALIDTISFYDDSEPTWNERPYFSAVEAKRGKTGIHMETSSLDRTFDPVDSSQGAYRLPGADSSAIAWEQKLRDRLDGHGYRVIFSGVGGDEILGGVPTAFPELADYMVSGNLTRLLMRTVAWCLVDRRPLTHMLFDTAKYVAHLYRQPQVIKANIPGWLRPRLRSLCEEPAASPDIRGTRRLGMSPSAIDNGLSWWSIMETLPHLRPAALTRYEYRYPYLDRDLVDFMFRVPREQVVRPGRRRSLMRRALKDLVPVEVLERRRKAYLARGPLASLQIAREKIEKLFASPLAAEYGLIDPIQLRAAYDVVVNGKNANLTSSLMRIIAFELWLRSSFTVIAPG